MKRSEEPGGIDLDTARLEAFSDAVMAVIITILAFELKPPAGPTLSDSTALSGFLIYVLCFAFIAIYWNNHHHLLRATEHINGAVMWANMLLLFCLSLVPVIAEWLRTFPNKPIPAASFGVVSLAAAMSYTWLVRAIVWENGKESTVGRAVMRDVKGKASVAMYIAAVGLAFVQAWIAYALYVAVSVMWLIPDRRITRAARDS